MCGAGHGERSADRRNQRNGYRERDWETRAGTVELSIPKLRRGSYFPVFLEPRRLAEKALTAVVQEAYVKARRDHHIVAVAVIAAVGVNTDGRRGVLGMTVRHSEAESPAPDEGLGRVPALARPPRPVRREAGDLGRARG